MYIYGGHIERTDVDEFDSNLSSHLPVLASEIEKKKTFFYYAIYMYTHIQPGKSHNNLLLEVVKVSYFYNLNP